MSSKAKRNLPSLAAFTTFEVAAKHLSFTKTANEIHVTQAAVSQQIRMLEKALGAPLFIRGHNSLELSNAGALLLGAVTNGLNSISQAVLLIKNELENESITFSSTVGVGRYWIKPLIDEYRKDHPNIKFTLLASDEDDTLRNFVEVDLSLICGNERCEVGENLFYLFSECVKPVCSQQYLLDHGPFDTPEALLDADLLVLHDKHWSSEAIGWQPLTWESWFADNLSLGTNAAFPTTTPFVSNHYPLLIDAAIRGEGVVLGWQHLVEPLITEGKLCIAHDAALRVDRGNYLKVNKASASNPHVGQFLDFILAKEKLISPW